MRLFILKISVFLPCTKIIFIPKRKTHALTVAKYGDFYYILRFLNSINKNDNFFFTLHNL